MVCFITVLFDAFRGNVKGIGALGLFWLLVNLFFNWLALMTINKLCYNA